jgi:hypothetical protein
VYAAGVCLIYFDGCQPVDRCQPHSGPGMPFGCQTAPSIHLSSRRW